MDWHPNEDAVRYFISEILPLVRAEVPGRVLQRRRPKPDRRTFGRPRPPRASRSPARSTTSGRRSPKRALCVVPLRAGSGTRLKIFEALAMGKAVVSTTVGAEGLDIESGTPLRGRRWRPELCPTP